MSKAKRSRTVRGVSRREVLQMGAGWAVGGALLPYALATPARAAEHPELGTYPAGSAGPSVFVGIVRRAPAPMPRWERMKSKATSSPSST